MPNLHEVEQIALQLSYDDRIDLMEILRLSLEAEHPPAEIEAMWAKECERRINDLKSGKTQTLSKEEVDAHFQKKFGWS
jgi:putative addiction module component (TIGR02574 family)